MPHLRVSPRHLGQMLLTKFCPRCFFYQVQMNFRLPFDRPMPGLMYNLDIFEKRIVQAHLDTHGRVPKWLKSLGCTGSVDFPSKMTMDLPKYDATLVGMPDAVFKKGNNKLCLIDWKTARYKGDDDPFMPAYETQLLGYTHLLEHNKIGKVDTAALVYFENGLKDEDLDPLDLLTDDGFDVPFRARIHEIEIDRATLDPLLKRIREFADLNGPPRGREKCQDCARLQALLDGEVLRRNAEEFARQKDSLARLRSRELEAERQAIRNARTADEDDFVSGPGSDFQDSIPGPLDL
jgi:hypothetical protein